jgi:hypothetical protein
MTGCEGPRLRRAHDNTEKFTKDILTKLGIVTGLLGALAFGASDAALAKPHHVARSVEKAPYNYTCQSSWFYPGYYCYEPGPYYNWYPTYYANNWYPGYYAYGSSSCTAAVWDGSQWVRRRVC